MSDLNYLRSKRIDPTTYQTISGENADLLLALILEERKKQLLLRGLRWEDIRRLNKDVKTAVTLSRDVEGNRLELLPNDIRYVWPFPEEAITNGGYVQNPR